MSSNSNETRRRMRKVTGGDGDEGPFEAIYQHNKPRFLVKTKSGFEIFETAHIQRREVAPKGLRQIPYRPYGYYEGDIPSPQKLFDLISQPFDLFLDLEKNYRELLSACVMLSYQQEKLRNVPYLFFYGDNESGKTVALTLLSKLVYRPLYGVSIPPADIYSYLGDVNSPACILEDEVQGIDRDFDKLKIYKAGYKEGATVPRIQNLEYGRIIKYYPVYCFKAFAAEQIPRIKGFVERLILISMTEGAPNKEWADISRADLDRIRNLRNMLLKWRLDTIKTKLPDVKLKAKGRIKELWKPILQVIAGLPVEDRMHVFLDNLQSQRLRDKQNTLEGHIVKVVSELYEEGKPLPFIEIWNKLATDLQGYVSFKPHLMSTPDFGIVTKQKVGYRLREVLGGNSRNIRTEEELVKAYDFDPTKLKRIAKKYGCSLVTKLPSLPTSTGSPREERGESKHWEDISLQVEKLSNSVTIEGTLMGFLLEIRQNSKISNEIPEVLFKELVEKHNVSFGDLLTLSKRGILKSSLIDNIHCNPGFVRFKWVKDAKINDFYNQERRDASDLA